jgi:CheY-like chemotaxis protein
MSTDPRYHVILLDDDFTVNYFDKIVLQDAGIVEQVHDFTSAREALRFLQQTSQHAEATSGKPDVLFIDINMPEMDGFEFIEQLELTCQDIYKEATLCILSSSEHAKDKKRANELGVFFYYSKPLDEHKIKEIVKILQARHTN